jgi:branched-chain amino acid transport system ATP-binding protein
MLSVEHLNVWYGNTEIVRDVSFTVTRDRVIALMGGNGTGKTTILRALSGLLRPRKGVALFNGVDIAGFEPHRIVKAGLTQVPQGRFVWPGMSVRDNLLLGAVTRAKTEIAELLEHAFEFFPTLARKQAMRAGLLSGGEQQMVAIARALMARPSMLMLDEPSAGLAPRAVEDMIAVIERLHKSGLGILLVEQNVGVAGALVDREAWEHVVELRHVVHPPARDRVGLRARDVLVAQLDRPLARFEQPEDRLDQRRLPGAVGPHDRHDLTLPDVDRYPVEDVDLRHVARDDLTRAQHHPVVACHA